MYSLDTNNTLVQVSTSHIQYELVLPSKDPQCPMSKSSSRHTLLFPQSIVSCHKGQSKGMDSKLYN